MLVAEVSIPIDIQDIYERKSYLGDKSIEQIIHELKYKQDGERIFNHIGHRWTLAYNSTSYIVTTSQTRLEVAQRAVDDLRTSLHNISSPPERIFDHFLDAQKGVQDTDMIKRKRNEATHDDDDAKTYYN